MTSALRIALSFLVIFCSLGMLRSPSRGLMVAEDDTSLISFIAITTIYRIWWGGVKKGIALERIVTGGHFRPPACLDKRGHSSTKMR